MDYEKLTQNSKLTPSPQLNKSTKTVGKLVVVAFALFLLSAVFIHLVFPNMTGSPQVDSFPTTATSSERKGRS